jgi:K+-sensing histidine kinase KdpD
VACVPDEFVRAGAVYSGIPCGMKRGQLRIYLGTAPGVGKTYAMLGEGHRRS